MDEFACHHDGVDATVRQRRMAFMACHIRLIAHRALVAVHHLHQRRLADDHGGGLLHMVAQMFDQRTHAAAAHLFIAREGEMNRHPELQGSEMRHQRKAGRKIAFHVGRAAAIELAVPLHHREGVA